MTIDDVMLRIKRLGFPVTAAVLFIATADGLAALLNAGILDLWTWSLAIALAAVVDAVLISALFEWLRTREFVALCVLLIFMAASGAASVNFWYRHIRGSVKTVETFDVQRDAVSRNLVTLLDRLNQAKTGLDDLNVYSADKAKEEALNGGTCGQKTARIEGPRARFRAADAAFFAGLSQGISSIPGRLQSEIDTVRSLIPEPGSALTEAGRRLELAVANASSIRNDPGLTQLAAELRQRIDDDAVERVDRGTQFFCPDARITAMARTVVGRIEGLPEMAPVTIVDWTTAGGGLHILPLLLDWKTWGKPGGLSGVDAAVIFLAVLVEFALLWTARGYARAQPPERILPALARSTADVPADALKFVDALAQPADRNVRRLIALIEKYRASLGLGDLVIVSHGTHDEDAEALAWSISIFRSVGWARRARLVPNALLNVYGWWHWKETRSCKRREAFWLDLDALDELRLAEVSSRMRVDRDSDTPRASEKEPSSAASSIIAHLPRIGPGPHSA